MKKRIFGKIPRQCRTCKRTFWIHLYRSKTAQACSISCSKTGKHLSAETKRKMSLANSGARCAAWKGGVTPPNQLARTKFRQKMQKLIFERDDYTCQLCGQRGGDLQVDHIQSWAEYVHLRFNMDNCRTVCVSCHYKITFGKPLPEDLKGWGHNLFKRRVAT